MEASHKLDNVNCDNVMKGLFLGTERLISSKYLIGGMGDGGGCHPRDNIALSWMAKKLDMRYDWYENLMICREEQTEWLADLIIEYKSDMPITILGKCFKKETNLTVGSPSILLKNLLEERGEQVDMYDPWVDDHDIELTEQCYFIGTNHDKFLDYKFPPGAVVIDPWRMIEKQDGVAVISVGKS